MDPTWNKIRHTHNIFYESADGRLIKVYDKHRDTGAAIEKRAIDLLVQNKIPTIKILDSDNHSIMMEKIVPGAHGEPLELMRLLAKMHEIDATGFPLLKDIIGARLKSGIAPSDHPQREWISSQAKKIDEDLQGSGIWKQSAFLHRDPSLANTLQDQQGLLHLIDLEGACLGPREWDMAVLAFVCQHFVGYDLDQIEDLLLEYEKLTGQDLDRKVIKAFVQIKECFSLIWSWRAIEHNPHMAQEYKVREKTVIDGQSLRWSAEI